MGLEKRKELRYVLFLCYQPSNFPGEFLNRMGYLVTSWQGHRETPHDKVSPAGFQRKPCSSQQCPEASHLVQASSWMTTRDDIPGKLFLDIKTTTTPQPSGSYPVLLGASPLVMILVLLVLAGNQKASVRCLFKDWSSQPAEAAST